MALAIVQMAMSIIIIIIISEIINNQPILLGRMPCTTNLTLIQINPNKMFQAPFQTTESMLAKSLIRTPKRT